MPIRPSSIRKLVLEAAKKARREQGDSLAPAMTGPVEWPVQCTVGPGLEGAIACESAVGYVNGSQGALIYRGYDIFDLCANSTFEEVSYLLLKGKLPTAHQLEEFTRKLRKYREVPKTLRSLMSFPVENMNTMAAFRLGINLMRQKVTHLDTVSGKRDIRRAISTDEDSIPMETLPHGESEAIYQFLKPSQNENIIREAMGFDSCIRVIAAASTIAAAISRLRNGQLPIEPDPDMSHAANYLYMITGRRPTPAEERIMDIALILHADHGMNASTFAAMVVASTLSDIYASVGAGVAALNGPLHGGANEQVVLTLEEIGSPERVKAWYRKAREEKRRIMGFGHRVYKTYDPRGRILEPLARALSAKNETSQRLFLTAEALEHEVVHSLGKTKRIYPNVDFYSGIVYTELGIPKNLFTPTFAVARVAGWSARLLEYLKRNRLFRPRAIYTGPLDKTYVPIRKRKPRMR